MIAVNPGMGTLPPPPCSNPAGAREPAAVPSGTGLQVGPCVFNAEGPCLRVNGLCMEG